MNPAEPQEPVWLAEGPGPWYRAIKTKHGLIIDPEPEPPSQSRPCLICEEPSATHRNGHLICRADDGRLMALPYCFADLDRWAT